MLSARSAATPRTTSKLCRLVGMLEKVLVSVASAAKKNFIGVLCSGAGWRFGGRLGRRRGRLGRHHVDRVLGLRHGLRERIVQPDERARLAIVRAVVDRRVAVLVAIVLV